MRTFYLSPVRLSAQYRRQGRGRPQTAATHYVALVPRTFSLEAGCGASFARNLSADAVHYLCLRGTRILSFFALDDPTHAGCVRGLAKRPPLRDCVAQITMKSVIAIAMAMDLQELQGDASRHDRAVFALARY